MAGLRTKPDSRSRKTPRLLGIGDAEQLLRLIDRDQDLRLVRLSIAAKTACEFIEHPDGIAVEKVVPHLGPIGGWVAGRSERAREFADWVEARPHRGYDDPVAACPLEPRGDANASRLERNPS